MRETKTKKKGDWLPFSIALEKIHIDAKILGIDNIKKWRSVYCKGQYRPANIPSNPQRDYKHKGWVSWGHWLGTGNKTGAQRKLVFNESFFKKWSRDMAYVLGFWFADGNIKQGRVFSIYQNNKDKLLMKNILKSMGATGFLYEDKRDKSCYISISSKTFYNDIIALGGIPAKSLTVMFPKIPEKYIGDFLRGNFDGDGSIYYDKCNKKYFACFCCGSIAFLSGIKDVFDKIGIVCKIISAKTKKVGGQHGMAYWLRFNAANTILLGDFLYRGVKNSSLLMPRKHQLFKLANSVMGRT